jgi:site-specific recombinase XerD
MAAPQGKLKVQYFGPFSFTGATIMTPLRQRMIRELELQRKSPKTIEAYVLAVAQLAQYFGRSPDLLEREQVRDYVHYLVVTRKLSYSSCNQKLSAIHFLFRVVLGMRDFDLKVPSKRSGRLPEPLSRSEITQLLKTTTNRKHRVLFMTCYGAGLRVSELVRLTPQDIHSDRMLIRVDQGKGKKDRFTLLSPRMLNELREYWREYRPLKWLFPRKDNSGPSPIGTAQKTFVAAKVRADIKHGRGIHCLRHSFATHLMEAGTPLPIIQSLMGHSSLNTTAKYLHVTSKHMNGVRSPLELIRLPDPVEIQE